MACSSSTADKFAIPLIGSVALMPWVVVQSMQIELDCCSQSANTINSSSKRQALLSNCASCFMRRLLRRAAFRG